MCFSFLCRISSAPRGRQRRNPCGRHRSAPCGRRRRHPCGHRRRHPRSPQKRPMRSPQTGSTRSPETGVRVHAPRPPPVELDAEGQALCEQLRTFRTQAVSKNTKFHRALPQLSRSPLEYQNVLFFSSSQLTTHLVRRPRDHFLSLRNGDYGVC